MILIIPHFGPLSEKQIGRLDFCVPAGKLVKKRARIAKTIEKSVSIFLLRIGPKAG
jgi:hypothetical protein